MGENDDAYYLHVDDNVAITLQSCPEGQPPRCDTMVAALKAGFQEVGFEDGDVQTAEECDKVVGYAWSASPPEFHLDPKREALLWESMLYLEQGKCIDVELLRSVLGVWVWASLLRRGFLALPHSLFDMINKNERRVIPWWPSALQEWRRMRHLLPYLRARLNRPVATTVLASDAEG